MLFGTGLGAQRGLIQKRQSHVNIEGRDDRDLKRRPTIVAGGCKEREFRGKHKQTGGDNGMGIRPTS